jgi:hypothetical protein
VIAHLPARHGRDARPVVGVSRAEAAAVLQLVLAATNAVRVAREAAARLPSRGGPVGGAVTDALLSLGEAREDLEELMRGSGT